MDAAAQTRLGDLRKWLTKQMRSIRLPDLLIEVDNDLRFTDHFLPPAQRGGRDAEDVCTLLAVVLAHGCNIGLHTMAQITQGVLPKCGYAAERSVRFGVEACVISSPSASSAFNSARQSGGIQRQFLRRSRAIAS